MPASLLVAEFGSPIFVYDAAVLRRHLHALRSSLPPRIDVYYSAKANPNPEIIRRFVREGAGVEIASAGEYERSRAASAPPERILFAGPGKSPAELEHVTRGGIGEIHVESFEEIEALDRISSREGRRVRVAVRVNPREGVTGGSMRMGGQPAPFGFDEEKLEPVIRDVLRRPSLEFRGIHMFAATQILDHSVLLAQWAHGFEVAERAAELAQRPLRTLDLGGGLGIPYFEHEHPLDLTALRAGAERLFASVAAHPSVADANIILEPGRFLVGPAGVYLTRVLSVKESRGRTFVVTDGGMNHHLAASGNLGQVIKRDFPVVNASRCGVRATQAATIVGPLCTPLDTLARNAVLAPAEPGDTIAILQSGAYGLTASPIGFLSHPSPAEVLVEDGRCLRIRARGTFEHPLVGFP